MPAIYLSADQLTSSTKLEAGSYHATALALSADIQTNSIKVEPDSFAVLPVGNKSCIWTQSLGSCFPVVFKFANGDIGLYHSNSGGVGGSMTHLLDRTDLVEIQIFEKGTRINSGKVKVFAEGLNEYFNAKENKPLLHIHPQNEIDEYGVTICYKAPNNKPIVLVGESGELGMASTLDGCKNKSDHVKAYHFEPVATRFPAVNLDAQRQMSSQLQELRAQSVENKKEPDVDNTPCCVIS